MKQIYSQQKEISGNETKKEARDFVAEKKIE